MIRQELDGAKKSRLEVIWASLIISLWIVLTNYALGLMKEPIGIPLAGALITLTLLAPLIYPRDSPYYDSLVFSPLFVSYMLLLNVVFSLPSIKLPLLGSLYVLFSTLLLSAVIAWNLISKLNIWELSVHLPIFFFVTFALTDGLWGVSLSVYEFIWLLSLSVVTVKNFKTYFSGIMSLMFSLLIFLGLYYVLPDLTGVPHMSIGSATEFTQVYVSLLISFTVASFINIISYSLVGRETVNLAIIVIRYFISSLTFVGLFYISMSVIFLEPFYWYLEYNLTSAFLVAVIISSVTATVAYLKVMSEKRRHLSSVLGTLEREMQSLTTVYNEVGKTGLWSEDALKEVENKLNVIKRSLEMSKAIILKKFVPVSRLQLVSDVLKNAEKQLIELSDHMKSMYAHALITYSKVVALVLATPYGDRLREGAQRFQEIERVDKIPQYVGSVANTLRESCTVLKNLVLNTYISVSEQLSVTPIETEKIEKIDCMSSKSLLEDIYFMLKSYDNMISVTLPKLRELHNRLIQTKGLVTDKLRKLKKKPLEGLEASAVLEKLYNELDEIPGIVSELEVISYLRRYSILYNNLLTIIDELINTLITDVEKVSLKIKAVYGGDVEIEDMLLGRMKRNIDLVRSKLSRDAIRSPANLMEGFENLLAELPTVLENTTLTLERLAVLNNLSKHLTLFGDYILQELAEKKSINVNELPFTTEVSVQLIWVLLMSRSDIEVYEGVIRLKEGGS